MYHPSLGLDPNPPNTIMHITPHLFCFSKVISCQFDFVNFNLNYTIMLVFLLPYFFLQIFCCIFFLSSNTSVSCLGCMYCLQGVFYYYYYYYCSCFWGSYVSTTLMVIAVADSEEGELAGPSKQPQPLLCTSYSSSFIHL